MSPRPSAKPRCMTCGNTMRNGRRCGPCVGGTPVPGSTTWRRWQRGICRTIRARLDAAGLWRLAFSCVKALVFDDGVCPPEAAALLADIAALPCSYGRYQVVLERALNEVGLSLRLPRPRPLVRVALPPLRIVVDEEAPAIDIHEVEAECDAATVEARIVRDVQRAAHRASVGVPRGAR